MLEANPSYWHLEPEPTQLKLPQPLKVSIVVSDLSTKGAGRWGGAVRPFLLAQALQHLGCSVEILGFGGEENSAIATSDFPIRSFPAATYPKFLGSAKQLLDAIQGDIIYAYKPKPSSFGLALIAKTLKRRPLLLDIDDWEMSWYGGEDWKYRPSLKQFARDVLRPEGNLRNPDYPLYLKWMESWVSKADVITTHNRFLQQRFGGVYIPNGKDTALFDPEQYDPEVSRKIYSLSGYKVLMFPGAPRPYKGVEDVLQALDQLNQPDLRLVIVGGSPYDDYDQQLIRQWGRWIIKIPKVPYHKMPEVISAAHIVVVPQQDVPAAQAQFPLKLTDGMAMAKPVLATRVGDIPEILGDTGYLVDSGSHTQLAEQISLILKNQTLTNEKAKDAREKCIKLYSISAMSQALLTMLEHTLF